MQYDFYEGYYDKFKCLNDSTQRILEEISRENNNAIEHIYSRIKTQDSTKEKLKRYNFEVSLSSSLTNIYDILGLRIICRFVDDVYLVLDGIKNNEFFNIIQIKDYIKSPKINGYRSLHILAKVNFEGDELPIEIQIRTLSQDSWATLEHQMKYKKNVKNKELLESELKRFADELASTDINMQTIKDLIQSDFS